MSKYEPLWEWISKRNFDRFLLTFAEIEKILGFPIDHSFLIYKRELAKYGYAVRKISRREQTVSFARME